MQPMPKVRGYLLEQLRNAIMTTEYIVQSTTQPDAMTYRDGGDGWTVVEVICHLRDFDKVFLERANLTMNEDFPDLPFPSPDGLAADLKYNEQDLNAVFEEWKTSRENYVGYFEGVVTDDDWERAGNHPKRGHFTLNDQLIVAVWHDMNHLAQIGKILTQKLP
jgi:uncharacterized damage-inducible protein DinB